MVDLVWAIAVGVDLLMGSQEMPMPAGMGQTGGGCVV
jgi:hypothetical protein